MNLYRCEIFRNLTSELTEMPHPGIPGVVGASKMAEFSWLHKMLAYHKKIFLDDLARLPPLTGVITRFRNPGEYIFGQNNYGFALRSGPLYTFVTYTVGLLTWPGLH